jgi:hypothetical protein
MSSECPSLTLQTMYSFVKKVALLKRLPAVSKKSQDPSVLVFFLFSLCRSGGLTQPGHFPQSWPRWHGESQKTGTPGLISKVIPSQDSDKKGIDPVYCCCCLSKWDLSLPDFWSIYWNWKEVLEALYWGLASVYLGWPREVAFTGFLKLQYHTPIRPFL